MSLTLEVPINGVSFGQVSVSILRELFKRNLDILMYLKFLGLICPRRLKILILQNGWKNLLIRLDLKHNKDNPVFKLWHIIHSFQGNFI